MNDAPVVALIVISSLSLLTSAATFVFVVRGAKQVQDEVAEVRTKTERLAKKTKAFLESLDDL